ncbi:hypothetical protein GUJ93_ZPchr0005g16186 [Zizania palustris]|uniref:Uncharacterized protein n=1 Tax=Zizania palustris TaxID=103762 RepID=A0A8J5S8G7_ZIZPA|nr:hypothetical protein GUJ93_ZPchr0005g16186 [Zizania palustris]
MIWEWLEVDTSSSPATQAGGREVASARGGWRLQLRREGGRDSVNLPHHKSGSAIRPSVPTPSPVSLSLPAFLGVPPLAATCNLLRDHQWPFAFNSISRV